MRLLLLLFFLAALAIKATSQTSDTIPRPLSDYEKFISRTGVMIRTEQLPLGKTRVTQVFYQKATDLSNQSFSESIYILGSGTSFWSAGGVLWIDLDEIPGIIKAIEFCKSRIAEGKPKNEVSYYYITRNRIVTNCYYNSYGITKGWYISIYQRYQYLSGVIPGTKIDLREKDIDDVETLLRKSLDVNNPKL